MVRISLPVGLLFVLLACWGNGVDLLGGSGSVSLISETTSVSSGISIVGAFPVSSNRHFSCSCFI